MAFCNKCGAQLLEDASFCTNCGAQTGAPASQPQYAPQYQAQPQYAPQPQYQVQPQYQPQYAPQQKPSGVYGLGKAIASAILSIFAFSFGLVAMIFGEEAVYMYDYGYYYSYGYYYGCSSSEIEAVATTGLIMAIFAIPLCILSIIFGAKSIGNYKYARKELGTNPVATLIIGISGLAFGALGAIFMLLGFFMSVSVM